MTYSTIRPPRPEDYLAGGGEMGRLIRSVDWSATPLGPVVSWPQSLRTAVSMMLESRFGTYIAWGPQYIQLYNDAYRPILGATKHPAVGKRTAETFAESWHIIEPMFDGVMRGEAVGSDDWMLPLDRYGYLEECYFTFCYSPIRDESGGVGGVLVTVTETTGRVLGERRLRALRDLAALGSKAKAAEDIFPEAARILDDDPGDVPFALFYAAAPGGEPHLVAASGYARESVAPDVTPPSVPPATWGFTELDGLRHVVVLEDLVARAGRFPGGLWPEPPAHAAVLTIAPPGHAPYGYVVVGVSARRALDEAYRDFLELIASNLASALANARALEDERRRAEALAEIDRAKTAFFSNVSHEFRTPLTLLLSPLEDELAAARGAGDGDRIERLSVMERNGGRLLRLVNTLLDFSRIEAGRVDAVYERVDLPAVTAELASVFRSAVERAGLELVVDCPPLDVPVYVDRDMWEKVVLNLLSNALKFTFEGRIVIRVRRAGDAAVLEVEDTGVGIAPEELPRVFERFHRVRDARARTHEGTGIGLSLVQELVKLHHGRVSAASVVGRGTVFTVSVPTGAAHLPEDRMGTDRTLPPTATRATAYVEEALRWLPDGDVQSAAGGPGPAEESEEGTRRILLADDNADMREYLGRLLGARWTVEAVGDGQAALAAAQTRTPDLVLADVMMPGLDGFELLRRLRADARTATVPVILLSARAGEEATVEGLRAGADDYLVKPFSARELLARVRAHLALSRARADVAARERAATAAAEAARAQVATILETISDGFIALDSGWRFTYINAQAESLFTRLGKRRETMLGRSFWDEFPDLRGLAAERHLQRAMRERVTVDFTAHYAPLGAWFDVRAYAGPADLSIHFRDATSRVHAQREQRTLTALVQRSPDFIGVASLDQRAIFLNDAGRRLVGLPDMDAVRRTSIFDYFPEADRERIREEILPVVRERGHWDGEVRFRHFVTGAAIPVLWNVFTIDDPETGAPAFFACVSRDISDRKAAERALEEHAARLRSANAAKDEFLAILSHELRTPLSAILGWARMLRGRSLPPADVERAVNSIERNAGLQVQLIDDLLDVSRIVAGKLTLELEPVEVRTVVRHAVDLVQASADTAGITLSVDVGQADAWVQGESARLQQVVWNLLSNAIKFTDRGGRVDARVTLDDGWTEVSITDTGRGIAPDLLPHVFDRFRQDTRETRRGLGLGLAIVRHLVELHRGLVRAFSAGEGRGATFTVRLPSIGVGKPTAASGSGFVRPGRDAAERPALDEVRVLVVDDDGDSREVVATILEVAGARVTQAGSVREARSAWTAFRFDVIVTDLSMPDEDGHALIRQLRASGGRMRGTPVVAVSAYARGEDRVKALSAGFDRYISKPADPDALVRVVAECAATRVAGRATKGPRPPTA